jgi:hypothetical protein
MPPSPSSRSILYRLARAAETVESKAGMYDGGLKRSDLNLPNLWSCNGFSQRHQTQRNPVTRIARIQRIALAVT